jgi:hypothetical protein
MVKVDWSADYVERIAADGKTLDLTGWLTLSNRSGATFGGAPTSVVAGRLARVDPDLPDITPTDRSDECWPMGTTSDVPQPPEAPALLAPAPAVVATDMPSPPPPAKAGTIMELAVVAQKRAVQTELGDYKLYSLVEPTTLAARETKQIRFLHQPKVKFETLYVLNDHPGPHYAGETEPTATKTTLSFENKTADGLGEALPAGAVSMRQPKAAAGGLEMYVGENSIRDVPVNEPFEIEVGDASDVEVTTRTVSDTDVGTKDDRRDRASNEYVITNAKHAPVTFELRMPPGQDGLKVRAESVRHTLKNGKLTWRVSVPAGGTETLDLTVDTDE